jgi:hypothetical protein
VTIVMARWPRVAASFSYWTLRSGDFQPKSAKPFENFRARRSYVYWSDSLTVCWRRERERANRDGGKRGSAWGRGGGEYKIKDPPHSVLADVQPR